MKTESKSGGHESRAADSEMWLRMYRGMQMIRLFEEQVNELYTRAVMPGLAHLYIGEEAVAVGICEALHRDDYITSTHRGHGHCLAKGASPDRMFAELLGKEAGYCKGKGGSMHIADPASGNLGANAIVGGSAGIATGAAFSAKYRGTKQVAVCFFGEGALGQGLLYEVMNLARLWNLPVIYVCENNMYNEYTHFSETTAGEILATAGGVRDSGGKRGRAGYSRGTRGGEPHGRAGARRKRAFVSSVQYLPVSRPPRRRREPRILPRQAGRNAVEGRARSDQGADRLAAEREARGASAARRNSSAGEIGNRRGSCVRFAGPVSGHG